MYKMILLCCFSLQSLQGMYPSLEGIGGESVLSVQPDREATQTSLYGGLLQELTDGDDAPKEEVVQASKDAVDPQGGGPQADGPDGGDCCDKMQCCAQIGECCCEGAKCVGCTSAAAVGCLSSASARCLAVGRRVGEWVCALC